MATNTTYDSNGNIIFSADPVGQPNQQVSDTVGNIINPAKEDGNLLSIKTDVDKFTFTGSNLNVNIAAGSLSITLDHSTSNVLVYGNDGTTDRKLLTNASGNLQVGITNATLAVTQSGAWTVAATQSGTWNVNNISGTISLPTGASTETTLAAIKTDTDKLTFTATRLLVDGSGVTQPVSGTITANIGTTNGLALDSTLSTLSAKFVTGTVIGDVNAAQKGTWNVNNISGTISLPTGASTAAKQPALGTAGTASADVITVQGIASMTPLKVDGSGVTQPISGTVTVGNATLAVTQSGTWNLTNISGTISLPTGASTETTLAKLAVAQGSTTSGQSGTLILGAVTTAAPTYSTAQSNPLSLMTTGALRTDTSSWMGSTAPTVGSKTSANSIPVVVASDQAAIPVNNNDGAGNALASSSLAGVRRLQVSSMPYDMEASIGNTVFVTAVDVTLPTGGTETNAVFLKNPNASGKTLSIKKILCHTTVNTNGTGVIRIYANPTTSANGTAATASPMHVGGGGTAVATPFTGPTSSANGARLASLAYGSGTSSAGTYILPLDGLITVNANNTILITGTPTANNINVGLTIIWSEF